MNEITLSQFLENESVFTRIQSLSPYPFFDQMQPLDMDKHLDMFYGDKIVYPKMIKYSLDQLVNNINSYYSKKWENYILVNSIDIANGAERTVNESNTNKNISTGSNNTDHKLSAFNSDELVTDKADHTANTNTSDGEGTRLLTEKSKSMLTAYNNLLLSQKVNIIELVIKDVASYLTLDIY